MRRRQRKADPRGLGFRPTCSFGMQALWLEMAGRDRREVCDVLDITEAAPRMARRSLECGQ